MCGNFFQSSKDIRGFQTYGFGPRDPITGDALGGQFYWNATAEVSFPMPAIPESMGIRGAFFADIGQLWGLDSQSRDAIIAVGGSTNQLDDNSLRASVGASRNVLLGLRNPARSHRGVILASLGAEVNHA